MLSLLFGFSLSFAPNWKGIKFALYIYMGTGLYTHVCRYESLRGTKNQDAGFWPEGCTNMVHRNVVQRVADSTFDDVPIRVLFWHFLGTKPEPPTILQVAPEIKAKMMLKGTTMVSYQPLGNRVNFFRMIVSNPATTKADIDFLVDEIERIGKPLRWEIWAGMSVRSAQVNHKKHTQCHPICTHFVYKS